MSEKLFESDFPTVSSKEWMDKIVKDLRGIPFDKLNWHIDDTTLIDPYYTIDRDHEFDSPIHNSILNQIENPSWNIIQDLSGASASEIEKSRLSDVSIIELQESDNLSNNEDIYCFTKSKQSLESIRSKYNKIIILTNPINTWISGESKDLDLQLVNEQAASIHLSSSAFHNAGADDFTEIAMALSSLNEYLHHLRENDSSSKKIILNLTCGINFYSGVAKLRAIRILVDQLLSNYNFKDLSITINANTSSYYNSHKDQYTNLLRHTTMALSAVMGGADGVNVVPFEKPSALAYRMARNIQHLIKEEAYMDKVEDMTAGSYFFEELTLTFIDKAWSKFLKLEDEGGFIKSMKSGHIKNMLETQHKQRVEIYKSKEATMIGVNKYNMDEENDSISSKSTVNTSPWVLPAYILSKDI